jgi:di/tricarboxylate transporter
VRRILFLIFLIGCTVSLIVSRRLTLRLIVGGAAAWVVIPLLEAASFAIVRRRAPRRGSFARDLDRFSAGDWPWVLWLIALSGVLSFLTPTQADAWFSTSTAWIAHSRSHRTTKSFPRRSDAGFRVWSAVEPSSSAKRSADSAIT